MRNGKRHTPDASKIPDVLHGVPWRKVEKPSDIDISDGMSLLAAVPVCKDSGKPEAGWFYELSVIDVSCDEDCQSVCCQGDPWGWDLDDIDWYVVLSR